MLAFISGNKLLHFTYFLRGISVLIVRRCNIKRCTRCLTGCWLNDWMTSSFLWKNTIFLIIVFHLFGCIYSWMLGMRGRNFVSSVWNITLIAVIIFVIITLVLLRVRISFFEESEIILVTSIWTKVRALINVISQTGRGISIHEIKLWDSLWI